MYVLGNVPIPHWEGECITFFLFLWASIAHTNYMSFFFHTPTQQCVSCTDMSCPLAHDAPTNTHVVLSPPLQAPAAAPQTVCYTPTGPHPATCSQMAERDRDLETQRGFPSPMARQRWEWTAVQEALCCCQDTVTQLQEELTLLCDFAVSPLLPTWHPALKCWVNLLHQIYRVESFATP